MSQNERDISNQREIWNDYNDRQKFEHELINRTNTWLLTTQTLLFAGYGLTFTSDCAENGCADELDEFRDVVAVSGLVTAAITFVGVSCLIYSKYSSWVQYCNHFKEPQNDLPGPLKDKELPWGVSTPNTRVSVGTDLVLPLAFIVAWLVLWI